MTRTSCPPPAATSADAQATAQVAADLYRALPASERTAISTEMAAKLGPLWFGNRTEPDQDATTQPIHATTLTTTLTERGHLTLAPEPAPRAPCSPSHSRPNSPDAGQHASRFQHASRRRPRTGAGPAASAAHPPRNADPLRPQHRL
jgi:hypothetical protein